ncbi:MAG: alkaline phosphatase family protein, partial [Deltaproteobacteria bacterium]|nr:alkaline phosphatase family protein [Deltaproteobacteria bacterium]
MMLLSCCAALFTCLGAWAGDPKVVLVVLDGVRALEVENKATDDDGRPVSTAELLPNLTALRKKGVFFSDFKISNPAGVSFPAYADIFAGRRQEKIIGNKTPAEDRHSHYPTIFDALFEGLHLSFNDLAIHASWSAICELAGAADFYRSCGWKTGLGHDKYLKPEVYKDSRSDMDTFFEFASEVPKRHPRFIFVHLVDADEEAHLQQDAQEKLGLNYGIFNYHKALTEEDYYLGRMWKLLQDDPFYKDNTTLIVTTDHGRDNFPDGKFWNGHGECRTIHKKPELCS